MPSDAAADPTDLAYGKAARHGGRPSLLHRSHTRARPTQLARQPSPPGDGRGVICFFAQSALRRLFCAAPTYANAIAAFCDVSKMPLLHWLMREQRRSSCGARADRSPYSSLTGSGDGHLLVMYVKVVGRVVVSYGCEHFSHDGCARSRADRATRRPRKTYAHAIFF